ncbi:MAG: COQ9 family protein [Alphaproteobacteria bacterium]|nr:COQ9 family protein [Alphaproteobacteria bacterium]
MTMSRAGAKGEGRLVAARAAILAAALPDARIHGWMDAVMQRAIAATGVDAPLAARAFPRGARSLVEEFHRAADRNMAAALRQHDLPETRTGQRIALAVRLRIEAMADASAPRGAERVSARRAVALLALPENAVVAAGALARTSDAIWRAVGDRSVDFSWYTKRASLGAIYAATTLVWLQDESDGAAETWSFLGRRLKDIATFGATKARALGVALTPFSRGLGPEGPPTRWIGWRGIPSAWLRPSGR